MSKKIAFEKQSISEQEEWEHFVKGLKIPWYRRLLNLFFQLFLKIPILFFSELLKSEKKTPKNKTNQIKPVDQFFQIISKSEFYMDIPDCMFSGEDYKNKLESMCKISAGILELNKFTWKDFPEKFHLYVTINNKNYDFSINALSDAVDSEKLLVEMNIILKDSGYNGEKRYYSVDGKIFDFGFVFTTEDKKQELERLDLISHM